MASKVPIVRQINWAATIPSIGIVILLLVIFSTVNKRFAPLLSVLVFFSLTLLLRAVFTKFHMRGMKKVKQKNFADAVQDFKDSKDYFEKNPNIDTYRSLFILSMSRISYLEMAHLNIAFCYGQSGEGKKSEEWYRKTLDKFPKSEIAQAALKSFNSMRESLKEE